MAIDLPPAHADVAHVHQHVHTAAHTAAAAATEARADVLELTGEHPILDVHVGLDHVAGVHVATG